jgi:hypothetical protein
MKNSFKIFFDFGGSEKYMVIQKDIDIETATEAEVRFWELIDLSGIDTDKLEITSIQEEYQE